MGPHSSYHAVIGCSAHASMWIQDILWILTVVDPKCSSWMGKAR